MLHARLALPICALSGLLLASCASSSTSHADDPSAKAAGGDDAAAEAEHAIHVAELNLAKARIETEGAVLSAGAKFEVAGLQVAAAKDALEAFAAQRAVKLDEARLGLDRNAGRAKDAELELAELEAMYADEEFAEKTKELVITRGRREMEFARRALELSRRKLERLETVELPEQARKLETKLIEATAALEAAERARQVAELSRQLDIAKAEKALEDARDKKKGEGDA